MIKLLGKPLADKMLNDTKTLVSKLERAPVLRVVCDNKEQPYFKGIVRDAEYCGIEVTTGGHEPQDEIDGVISLEKDIKAPYHLDVDGGGTTPCTAEAIMELLKYYHVPLSGKRVCVIGRSPRVGRPLTNLMISADATVTNCHSKTRPSELYWNMFWCDILISCVGNAAFDGDLAITQYVTVVDVGNDFTSYGDCNALVPFIGGVGPVTRAVLMRHVYEKAKMKE